MMDVKFNILGSDAKISDLVKLSARELVENGLDAFDFDIPGMSPEGPIILHFEVTVQKVGDLYHANYKKGSIP